MQDSDTEYQRTSPFNFLTNYPFNLNLVPLHRYANRSIEV